MVRKVEAFSTIGILSDPIMSYMKRSSEYRIAEVIIHEQVHATVFMTDYPDASENLATFIGSEGALGFMKSRYGESSDEYKLCLAIDADSETYNRLLRDLYSTLDGIYKSEKTRNEKLKEKALEIAKWKAGIESDYRKLFKTNAYSSVKDIRIDNAYIATYLNYTRNLDLYKKLFEKTGSIRGMIGVMKNITKDKSRNPETVLLEYLDGKTGDIVSGNEPD
jgi:predicted aminopeptidase